MGTDGDKRRQSSIEATSSSLSGDDNTQMTAPERLESIRGICKKLETESWTDIDLILKQFGFRPPDTWNGSDMYAYCVASVEKQDDAHVSALAAYLLTDRSTDVQSSEKAPWESGRFRLFLSHVSADKQSVSELKKQLKLKAIDAFVAHEDIEPTREWLVQIETALSTCDALAAFLTQGFHESKWTDHEIGFCVSRRVLIVPIRLGVDPYGFISRYQALTPKTKDPTVIASKLFDVFCSHEQTSSKLAEALVNLFADSSSFAEAKANSRLLDRVSVWTPGLLSSIQEAVRTNGQISGAFGVPETVKGILNKQRE
jgi:hypothetical protein